MQPSRRAARAAAARSINDSSASQPRSRATGRPSPGTSAAHAIHHRKVVRRRRRQGVPGCPLLQLHGRFCGREQLLAERHPSQPDSLRAHGADPAVDLPPDPERQQPGAVLRPEPGATPRRRQAGDHVRRRGRCRRGEAGAQRDRRVPQVPGQVRRRRRAHPQGRAAGRPSWNRQDPAQQGRRR